MSGYRVYRHWSSILGSEAERVSLCDERGSEFFAIIPHENGKRGREIRDTALEALVVAIETGRQPGQVRIQ